MPIRTKLFFNVFRIPASRALCGSLLLCYAVHVQAEPVSLAWNASTFTNLSGYQIYCREASGDHTIKLDVGNQTTSFVDLQEGKTYYCAVQAYGYDTNGTLIQSSFSDEVSTIDNSSSTSP